MEAVSQDIAENRSLNGSTVYTQTSKKQRKHAIEDGEHSSRKKFKSSNEFNNFSLAGSSKRKKVAMLLSYCGQGYYGMQRNPGVKSIEEDLLTAMLKANVINQENFDMPQSMAFQRAARTDKGVSAVQQVVSLHIPLKPSIVEDINTLLPSQIKVMCVKRTTKGFNSKSWCDARTYSYTLPTFAFAPSTELTCESYRITDEVLNKVNSVLQLFKGTHNFHNFTAGRKADDASAKRYIIEFECGIPFVESGLEFVTIKVKGQSFMLHQIRKMIGITIAISRDLADASVIEKAWSKEKVDIPIAPGVGLVLEEVHYEYYNRRFANDGVHVALEWNEINEELTRFKSEQIHAPIVRAELEDKSMFQWLSTLPLHTYDVREAGPPGIPERRSSTRSEIGRAHVRITMESENDQQTESNPAESSDQLPQEKQCSSAEEKLAASP